MSGAGLLQGYNRVAGIQRQGNQSRSSFGQFPLKKQQKRTSVKVYGASTLNNNGRVGNGYRDTFNGNGRTDNGFAGTLNGNRNGNGHVGDRFRIPDVGFTVKIDKNGAEQLPMREGFKASGKTAVITGASQGIGRAVSLYFASKGYNVVVAARDVERVQNVAEQASKVSGRSGAGLAVPTDVTDEMQVRSLVNTVLANYQSVEVVINCAGVMTAGDLEATPIEAYRTALDVNFLGPVLVTQHFIPLLENAAAKKGMFGVQPTIVYLNGGKVPAPRQSSFNASKYALTGYADAIRQELEPKGIHVVQVHPGIVRSSILDHAEFYGPKAEDDRQLYRQAINMPIAHDPKSVAREIYNGVVSHKNEVYVGPLNAALALTYNTTGLNPLQLINLM